MVLIHEFCHAYMDVVAGSASSYDFSDPDNVYYCMEESMANVMTLTILEKYFMKNQHGIKTDDDKSRELLEYAIDFMKKQPDAYAFAVNMWENGVCDYDLWMWNKEKCISELYVIADIGIYS